jgi:caffeoyl-CoA O-methyltransferase
MHSNNIDRKIKTNAVIDRLEKQSRLERLEKVNFYKNDLMLAITEDTGKFLNILLTSMNANTVLEIGTSTGYSALWFALAFFQMEDNITQKVEKNIITIDNDPLKIKIARKNFVDAEVQNMIKIIEGNALEILTPFSDNYNLNLNGKNNSFDFIFFDAYKENITIYFVFDMPLLKKGGIIVTDNILYPEEYRLIMSQYVEYVRRIDSVTSVTVPIGNGQEITLNIK